MNKEINPYLKEKLINEYSPLEVNKIIEGYYSKRYVSLRINTLKSNKDEICSILNRNNIEYQEVSWFQDALIILNVNEDRIKELSIYEEGKIYLQSLSSMLPPLLLDVKPNTQVLDMCAAPGGKTTEIAALADNNIMITACEKNKIRCDRLKYNLDKQGVKRVNVMNIDALKIDDFFSFDQILLDTPCSGSGTVNSEEDYNEKLLENLIPLQESLLNKAIKLLKPNSEMIYSTCSILKEENEQIIEKVLKNNPNIEVIPFNIEEYKDLPLLPVTIPGSICLYPNEFYEGFYVIKLRKNDNI